VFRANTPNPDDPATDPRPIPSYRREESASRRNSAFGSDVVVRPKTTHVRFDCLKRVLTRTSKCFM
jgi:hypothetical protein